MTVAFAALCLAASVGGGEFVIAERGRAENPPIVIPADAASSFRYAAEELRDHVRGMTDVELAISDFGARGVFLEKGEADLGDDGFRIRTGADGVHISGGCRGVLYGVYELLEEYGGCGWYASWRTVVPRRTSFAVPDGLDIVKKPAFLLREPSWCDVRRHADFAARLRMNGAGPNPQAKHGGAAYRFVKGLPRSHTFDRILPADRYFKDHPEWFSEIGGVRRGGGKRTQICLTNPEALDEAVKNVLAMIAADPSGARVIGVSQNDYREYCQCAACAAVDEAEGSPAGTLLRFVNALAERVARVYPDILVETLVYQYTRKPPKLTRPAKNVMPCFCTYEAEIAHPLRESPYVENRNMVPDLEAWSRLTDNLFLWDYTTNWRNFLQPMATVYSLQPNFRYYRDLGVKYSYSEGGEYHADFAELRAWLIAKLSWDPDADQERLLKRFFEGYYGAAAPQAEACFCKVHELYRAQPKKVQTIWHRDQPEVLTDAYLDWAIAEWERAEAAVKDDPVLLYNVRTSSLSTLATRLNRIAATVKYVWATRDPSSVAEPKDAKALYGKALAIFDEAKAKGHAIRIGTGDGFRTERMFAAWKRIFDFRRPASAGSCGRAGFDELTRSSQVAKPVDDPSSLTGRAYELSPHSQGTSLFLSAGNVAYDKGVRYRLRVHARADKVPGAKGEALRVRVYHNKNDDRPIEFAQNVETMSDGWAWYDAGTFLPEDSHEISIGGGRFDRGGGVSAVKALYVDALEFVPVPDAAAAPDPTAVLQEAFDSDLEEVVVSKAGSPWIVDPLFIRRSKKVIFEPGAELVARRGAFKGKDDRLLTLVDVTNVTLVGNGATLRMWASDYADPKAYEKSEHRHALALYGCANVTIKGLNLVASGGDGIYIGASKPGNAPCRDIVIRSCVCDENRRQGISVISAENLLIEDCILKNTHGTAPKDGIDFEPNKPFNRFVNCRVRNCTFENNAGYSIEVALQHSDATTAPCDIVVENCRATGDLGAVKLRTRVGTGGKPTGRVLVRDCTFARMGFAPIWTIQNPPGAIDLRFERCTFDGFAPEDAQMPFILQEAPFGANPVPAKPEMVDVCVKGGEGRPEHVVDRFGDDPPIVPDFAKATVADAHPGEMAGCSPLAIRYHAKFVVYADSPREIILKVRRKTGKKGKFGFSAGSIPVREESDGTVRFTPPAKGFYALEAFYGKDSLSLLKANAPVALDCSGAKVFQTRWGRDDVAANFQSEGGMVYLPLRRGQVAELRFAGMAPQQSVAVSVTRPDGTPEFGDASLRFWTRRTVRAEADGLWKVSFDKPASGNLENFRFGVRGVPALVFLTSERYWYFD